MRKYEPHLFTGDRIQGESGAHAEGHSVYWIELLLAQRAFAAAAGLPDGESKLGREWLMELLNEAYLRYGVSSGFHETRELVREFEAAAADQAKSRARHR